MRELPPFSNFGKSASPVQLPFDSRAEVHVVCGSSSGIVDLSCDRYCGINLSTALRKK